MATVESICETCEGKRFQASVLEYTLGGRDITEVLAMPVTEAAEFFDEGESRTPPAHKILGRLADVGLGYLALGQPLTTLSGGERQRLKLAAQMVSSATSTYSTSRPPAFTSPTSSSCRPARTGSSTPASVVVTSTTRRSWRTPTGSSTSAPAPAMTAAGSSSRAPPATSSPPAPPSRASTSRPTSPKAGAVRPLGVPDGLVGEDGDAVTDGLGVDEAHGFLVAGLAEEALAGPEHDREDLQPQLVDEVVLDQRARELEAGGDDDFPVELLLQL